MIKRTRVAAEQQNAGTHGTRGLRCCVALNASPERASLRSILFTVRGSIAYWRRATLYGHVQVAPCLLSIDTFWTAPICGSLEQTAVFRMKQRGCRGVAIREEDGVLCTCPLCPNILISSLLGMWLQAHHSIFAFGCATTLLSCQAFLLPASLHSFLCLQGMPVPPCLPCLPETC